jgi:hypothetical protein
LCRAEQEDGVKYPRCTAGERAGPPEDVGGYPGYADFLEAWLDPEHEEHKAMRRWAGKKFDPERFDLEATNKAIAKPCVPAAAITASGKFDLMVRPQSWLRHPDEAHPPNR